MTNKRYNLQKKNRKLKISFIIIFAILSVGTILYCILANGSEDDIINNSSDFVEDVSIESTLIEDKSKDESSIAATPEAESSPDTPEGVMTDNEINGAEDLNEEWCLLLINRNNPVPDGYTVELEEIENGHKVDARIADALRTMFADARADGILPRITSAYRPAEQQIAELQEYIDRYIAQGMTQEEAENEAKKWVAPPGYSEHETGLAVDISTANWSVQNADVVWDWLAKNSWKYGFILRYTEHCKEVTGASVEPWHFRYVGKLAAKEIYESGLCLEEYLQ